MSIKIISRSSTLALLQVKEIMAKFPELLYTVQAIKSFGDKHQEISLMSGASADFFTRELDDALLNGEADIAIHSAKDLPFPLRPGLAVIALLASADKSDCLVSRDSLQLADLPHGARIGTSSASRKTQLLALRADLEIVDIRGTIEDRLALIDSREIDALIVAKCALDRLGMTDRIAEVLPFETHPLQGNLAVVASDMRSDLIAAFARVDVRKKYGRVYITGSGAGDRKLLTIRATEAIKMADVILYDDLLDPAVIRDSIADKIYVGKRKEKHHKEQGEINELLYELAVSGKNVCRLKGGDPFIFGRGGEEVRYLRERLVDIEIIPGITAAQAAASYAELPLTERGISSGVAYLSAHPVENITVPIVDTLVYYMGASVLLEVASKVVSSGVDPATPVALVSNASRINQQVIITTLGQILDGSNNPGSPLIIIIGKIVKEHNYKSWFSAKKKVLVTGLEVDPYQMLGEVIHTPLIQTRELDDYADVNLYLFDIHLFDWIVFTSFTSVRIFFKLLGELGLDARALGSIKIASVGSRTRLELIAHGIVPDLQPKDESATGLVAVFGALDITGKHILMPRSDLARSELVTQLETLGNEVEPLVVYTNSKPDNIDKVDLSLFDVVVFTSPSTVINFKEIYGEFPAGIEYIVRGKSTEKELRQWIGSDHIVVVRK